MSISNLLALFVSVSAGALGALLAGCILVAARIGISRELMVQLSQLRKNMSWLKAVQMLLVDETRKW
jgi:hypothetical protein